MNTNFCIRSFMNFQIRFEYCTWTFIPQDGRTGGNSCDFEWKKRSGNVEKQTCSLGDRVRYVGNYDAHECKVSF